MKTTISIIKELEYGAGCYIDITIYGYENIKEFENEIFQEIYSHSNDYSTIAELDEECLEVYKQFCMENEDIDLIMKYTIYELHIDFLNSLKNILASNKIKVENQF
ncbi:hypothetical protein [Nonlabens sp. Asnod3-A02]|uniref:hypothetical protein n=1 Tax=Nonlabens sp. Asnod3-A02 TaxID=3160579 RepID=UPI00386AB484